MLFFIFTSFDSQCYLCYYVEMVLLTTSLKGGGGTIFLGIGTVELVRMRFSRGRIGFEVCMDHFEVLCVSGLCFGNSGLNIPSTHYVTTYLIWWFTYDLLCFFFGSMLFYILVCYGCMVQVVRET